MATSFLEAAELKIAGILFPTVFREFPKLAFQLSTDFLGVSELKTAEPIVSRIVSIVIFPSLHGSRLSAGDGAEIC